MSSSYDDDNKMDEEKDNLIDIEERKKQYEEELVENVSIDTKQDDEEEFLQDINKSLSRQVMEELGDETGDEQEEEKLKNEGEGGNKKKGKVKKILLSVFAVLLVCIAFLAFTKPGRKIVYKVVALYLHSQMENDPVIEPFVTISPTPSGNGGNEYAEGTITPSPIPHETIRKEDYVMNFLIFGIEEIGGARNTDSMMIVSINIKDKSIKMASIMRDTYTEVEGHSPSKLNAVYAMKSDRAEGAALLINQLEQMLHIDISGYASVNFSSFENIIDMLGGVTVELTQTEADYLNSTNYISNPENRNVSAGVNTLNGNQAVGYCRVRKVPTLGGADSDYGRTLRQRRVLTALFNKYKSKGVFDLITIANKCLSYVRTNLTADDIAKGIEMFAENGITDIDSARFPADGTYHDCGINTYNGLKYTLIIDDEKANVMEVFKFIFGDTDEEAEANYELYKNID